MVLLAAIVVTAFFIYFQRSISVRNGKKFEKNRKRYDQVLEQLLKNDDVEKKKSMKDS